MHHTKSVTTNIKSVKTHNNDTVPAYLRSLQYQTSLYAIIYIMTYVRISILQQLITYSTTQFVDTTKHTSNHTIITLKAIHFLSSVF